MNSNFALVRAAIISTGLLATLILTGCTAPSAASTASVSSTPSTSATQQARIFTKDVNVCFENKSTYPVTIDWKSGVSANTGSGALTVGQRFCGEGRVPKANLTFTDNFSTIAIAENPLIGYPTVAFKNAVEHTELVCVDSQCTNELRSETYPSASYSQGETVGSAVEGHSFTVTRNANDDWIQFTVVIND